MQRDAVIDATPAEFFAQVDDHRNFAKWNPFNELDPAVVNTWKMYGPQYFVGKAFSLFMSAEDMCGPMFEKGLADLAKTVEKTP